MTQVQRLSPSWLFEPCMLWMNSNPKAYDWTLLGIKAQNCFLNHSKPNTWAHQRCIRMSNIKGQKLTICMLSKCKPQAISSKYQKIIWFKPSKCKPKPFHHNQGSSTPSLKHPKWTRRSKWPNFAPLHIWFATSWLSLKFVSLFHVSMFLWILKIHVAFDVLCSCIYLKKKNQKKFKKRKNFKISKSFPKKEKIFQKKSL